MSTNKTVLMQGIKYLLLSLPLIFIGPIIVTNAFENKQNNWHYLVLGLGIALSFLAVFLIFKGLNTIVKSLFNN